MAVAVAKGGSELRQGALALFPFPSPFPSPSPPSLPLSPLPFPPPPPLLLGLTPLHSPSPSPPLPLPPHLNPSLFLLRCSPYRPPMKPPPNGSLIDTPPTVA